MHSLYLFVSRPIRSSIWVGYGYGYTSQLDTMLFCSHYVSFRRISAWLSPNLAGFNLPNAGPALCTMEWVDLGTDGLVGRDGGFPGGRMVRGRLCSCWLHSLGCCGTGLDGIWAWLTCWVFFSGWLCVCKFHGFHTHTKHTLGGYQHHSVLFSVWSCLTSMVGFGNNSYCGRITHVPHPFCSLCFLSVVIHYPICVTPVDSFSRIAWLQSFGLSVASYEFLT